MVIRRIKTTLIGVIAPATTTFRNFRLQSNCNFVKQTFQRSDALPMCRLCECVDGMNFGILLAIASVGSCLGAEILMLTMGGTKSHKIPFLELAKGLTPRGHNVTFLSGFPADYTVNGLHEITPAGLSEYIQNYTNWDLVGVRMNGKMPYTVWDVMRYAFQSYDAMLSDAETKNLLNRHFDLVILGGAFPECALGLVSLRLLLRNNYHPLVYLY